MLSFPLQKCYLEFVSVSTTIDWAAEYFMISN